VKIETRAARKYAGALFQVAVAQNILDQTQEDLREVTLATQNHPDLMVIMRQPRIQIERKKDLIRRLFSGSANDLMSDFLQMLTDKRRFPLIEAIHNEFARLLNEHRRVLPVEATSAVPLEADQQERLRQRLSEVTGYEIRLSTKVDPDILGGLRIRMRGQLIDGSVATQLRRIRENWKQVRVTR
jgi:F-type H+-transporting ATPase subunit delta